MIDFNERAIPGVTSNFLMMEAYARYDFALKYITSASNVLDIASGVGYGTAKIATKSKNAIGLDINREAVSYAQQHFSSNSCFVVGDALSTPFKDNYFDVVVAFEMIEHLENPELFLTEMNRIIKKGGSLILSTPNKEVHSPDGIPMSPYHTKEFNFTELNQLLKQFFKKNEYFAQSKSKEATNSWKGFMSSQDARRGIVSLDVFGFRKLISKERREILWKYVGSIFGRQAQEHLQTRDFPIKKYKAKAEYFIVVCKK